MPDAMTLNLIVQGGATVAFLVLVFMNRNESAEREKTMRESAGKRDEQFLDAIKENSENFSAALKGNTEVLSRVDVSLVKMDTHLTDSLAEMRRKIDG